jgi:hypothetical protein
VSKDEATTLYSKSSQRGRNVSWISSGASLAAVAKKLSEIPKMLKYFCYDTGEHYLSVEGLLNNNTFQKILINKKPICERKSVFFLSFLGMSRFHYRYISVRLYATIFCTAFHKGFSLPSFMQNSP